MKTIDFKVQLRSCGVTVWELAKECGCSEMSIYRAFRSDTLSPEWEEKLSEGLRLAKRRKFAELRALLAEEGNQ